MVEVKIMVLKFVDHREPQKEPKRDEDEPKNYVVQNMSCGGSMARYGSGEKCCAVLKGFQPRPRPWPRPKI